MKILIVDDDNTNILVLSSILVSEGFDCITASNGEEAVKLFTENQIDLVLMDIVMPLMHGISALHEIKKVDPVARVAMLTASNSPRGVTTPLVVK